MNDFDLEVHRADLPILERLVPLNHCSQAPASRRTLEAAQRYLTSWSERGMDWEAWMGQVEVARSTFARLIGADPEDVAVGSSVSQLASSFASALDFDGQRAEIVVDADEFPTVSHVWRAVERRGASVRAVDLGESGGVVNAADLRLDERTRLVSISQGCYANGELRDLGGLSETVHNAGALLFVDAYQALGTLPVNVHDLGVDALASGCLKYLLGVPGLAFMYVRRELSADLRPTATGWFGRRDPFSFDPALDWADGARRFDLGTPAIFEAYVCTAGMQWLLDVGIENVRQRTMVLTDRLLDMCAERGLDVAGPRKAHQRTPLTAIRVPDAHAVEAALIDRGFVASARGPVIRFAPHFYNSLDDVDGALDALQAVLTE